MSVLLVASLADRFGDASPWWLGAALIAWFTGGLIARWTRS